MIEKFVDDIFRDMLKSILWICVVLLSAGVIYLSIEGIKSLNHTDDLEYCLLTRIKTTKGVARLNQFLYVDCEEATRLYRILNDGTFNVSTRESTNFKLTKLTPIRE